MNLGNIKLGIYDVLGLVIPGAILVCEIWIALHGWSAFQLALTHISGPAFTLLLLVSFVLGHLIQELAHLCLKTFKGPRFSAIGRDEFWSSDESEGIKTVICAESGVAMGSVDAAFDYCLARLGDRFPKRDMLMATSDLSRSFLVLVVLAVPTAVRLSWDRAHIHLVFVVLLLVALAQLSLVGFLSWHRMNRFRRMSETAVFRAYLGSRPIATHGEDSTEKIA